MNLHTSTCSNKNLSFEILDGLKIKLDIVENPYAIPVSSLFSMAARINKKRSFLFVSKVLGKHIPIKPETGIAAGLLLAARTVEKDCKKAGEAIPSLLDCIKGKKKLDHCLPFISEKFNPVIIGFAETATALGHSFFEAFHSGNYIHTTREILKGESPLIAFEEEHSHATSHRIYAPLSFLDNDREIILVDDELTTGKTALNVIQSIQKRFPRKKYTVASLLDWRSAEDKEKFRQMEERLGIQIKTASLLQGKANIVKETISIREQENSGREKTTQNISFYSFTSHGPIYKPSVTADGKRMNLIPYIRETGRFGLDSEASEGIAGWTKQAGQFLKEKRTGKKSLVLGTGEFMYIPMKIASYMGDGVFYQSTTRSPIYPSNRDGYAVKFAYSFPNPEDESIVHYVYNIPPFGYDEIFICFEREIEREKLNPMMEELKKTGIKEIKVIFFSEKKKGDSI